MASYREWNQSRNTRGCEFMHCERRHVSISELKEDHADHSYLRNDIPPYPKSVVFNVSQVCHVTDTDGLQNIFQCGGFGKPNVLDDNFLWWSLSPSKEDIADAEKRFLEKLFPDDRAQNQLPFLEDFTTSPAFKNQESRYGNFRFTFSLKALLYHYAKEFCGSGSPVLRVLDTKLYQKEILYTVLVHPSYIHLYDQYPRLPRGDRDRDVCGYSQGIMSWRCQAPSDNHRYMLEVDEEDRTVHARSLKNGRYYVWDHVAVAFYMERDWTLHVEPNRLRSSVSVCEVAEVSLLRNPENALSSADAYAALQNVIQSVVQVQYGRY